MSQNYYEKLKDPRWQKKRLEVMDRAGFKCQTCLDKTNTLNVHHIEYVKGFQPWDYPLDRLVCLCEKCHNTIEKEILPLIRELAVFCDPAILLKRLEKIRAELAPDQIQRITPSENYILSVSDSYLIFLCIKFPEIRAKASTVVERVWFKSDTSRRLFDLVVSSQESAPILFETLNVEDEYRAACDEMKSRWKLFVDRPFADASVLDAVLDTSRRMRKLHFERLLDESQKRFKECKTDEERIAIISEQMEIRAEIRKKPDQT